ncbi:hypothetical protein LEN26_015314 [Aphanomyces euteiches]|nr:hypothetical protein LEN26_015314 [Aphanomyces euteiches]KAH9112036.1 hypothetical protein AeMF1_013571 [Aphanomyces euteiches]KAH9185766.1 hypothetical protein AeNC1_012253 [Aphanomyces euteiches]
MEALPASPLFNNALLANDDQLNTPAVPAGGMDEAVIGREAFRAFKSSTIRQALSESITEAELGMAACRVADAITQFRGDALMMPWFEQALAAGLAPLQQEVQDLQQGFQYHHQQAIPHLTNVIQGLHQGQIGLRQDMQQGLRALQQEMRQGQIALQQRQEAMQEEMRQGRIALQQQIQQGLIALQQRQEAMQEELRDATRNLQEGQRAAVLEIRTDFRILLVNSRIFTRNQEAHVGTTNPFRPPAKFNPGSLVQVPHPAMVDFVDVPDEVAPAFEDGPPVPGPDVFPPAILPFPQHSGSNLTIEAIGYLCCWYNDDFGIVANDPHETVLLKFKNFLRGR